MRYLRCKCGRRQAWSSMGTWPCDRCDDCLSDLAEGPNEHHDPQPHKPVDFKGVIICQWCRRPLDKNDEFFGALE